MSQIIKNVFTLCIAPKFVQLIFELRYLVADGLRSKILRQSCMNSGAEPNTIMDTENVISPSATSLSLSDYKLSCIF